jgi:hypothetical protein
MLHSNGIRDELHPSSFRGGLLVVTLNGGARDDDLSVDLGDKQKTAVS